MIRELDMEVLRRWACCTYLDHDRNRDIDIMKELNTYTIIKFVENYRYNWRTLWFFFSTHKFICTFFVTNKNDEGVLADCVSIGTLHYELTDSNMSKVNVDDLFNPPKTKIKYSPEGPKPDYL
jgi:hypothetical protein